jgi:peptide deformylase
MAVIPIRLFGDPVLRARARSVEEVDDDLRALADSMVETMQAAEGVGLAANQVGDLRRILVVDFEPITGEPRTEAFINPEIAEREGTMPSEEGCLSIPDVREELERSERVTVNYLDREGQTRHIEAEGLLSAVLQHEIDHLDGILITDRISPTRRAMLRGTLKRIAREATQKV